MARIIEELKIRADEAETMDEYEMALEAIEHLYEEYPELLIEE